MNFWKTLQPEYWPFQTSAWRSGYLLSNAVWTKFPYFSPFLQTNTTTMSSCSKRNIAPPQAFCNDHDLLQPLLVLSMSVWSFYVNIKRCLCCSSTPLSCSFWLSSVSDQVLLTLQQDRWVWSSCCPGCIQEFYAATFVHVATVAALRRRCIYFLLVFLADISSITKKTF